MPKAIKIDITSQFKKKNVVVLSLRVVRDLKLRMRTM